MTNRKSTKRALLGSVMAMVLCLAMLVGATFAWFTDTASTGVNKIQAGNLDVALEMKDAAGQWVPAEGKTLDFVKAAAGEQVLWEPGCTYELPQLRVVNKGNLALKYKIQITGINGSAKLNEAIEWTIGDVAMGAEQHLAAGESNAFTIKGHMKESAGNEYMNESIDGIAITVVATQDTVESDSFNNTYDANATYPVVANVPGAHVIFNIVFFITIVSLVIQGTTVSWVARLLGLSTPLEKTGNDFGVELPEEIDSNLHDMTITQEMLEQADTLKDMNLPKGTLVMIVKRGDEYLIPNGTLKLHAGDKLLLISENSKE